MAISKKLFSKKNVGVWIFLGVALVVAVLLGVFVSPFASSRPDGLERVAEDKGFIKKAEDTEPAWKHSPMPDYTVKSVKNEKVSTALSGFIGVLLTAAVGVALALGVMGLGTLSKKKKTPPESTGNAP